MAGLLIAYNISGQVDVTRHIFNNGVNKFIKLKKLVHYNTIEEVPCFVAKFGRRNSRKDDNIYNDSYGNWICGIGLYFYKNYQGVNILKEILRDYLGSKENILNDLDGFFTIAIWDCIKKELTIITDRGGWAHSYYTINENGFYISSSSLVLASILHSGLDCVGCYEFLSTGTIYEDRTFYKNIKKFHPAKIYTIKADSSVSEKKYWSYSDIQNKHNSINDYVEHYSNYLIKSIKKTLKEYDNPLCDLTGGYDTRMLAAAMRVANIPFTTTVTGDDASWDVRISNLLAETFKVNHLIVQFPKFNDEHFWEYVTEAHPLTDGEYDMLEYAKIYKIHDLHSKIYDISVNGTGGEHGRVNAFNYEFPFNGLRKNIRTRKTAKAYYSMSGPSEENIFEPTIQLNIVEHFEEMFRRINEEFLDSYNYIKCDYINFSVRWQRWQGRIASSTNHIWPCLSPFALKDTLEAGIILPLHERKRNILFRKVINNLNRGAAEIPVSIGHPCMPANFWNMHRFFPILNTYSNKIINKIRNRYTIMPIKGHEQREDHIKSLWRFEEFRELLNMKDMRSIEFFLIPELKKFIESSQHYSFIYHKQLGRIATLERTLRLIS